MKLVALAESRDLAERIADAAGLPMIPVEDRRFEDGEDKIRPMADVRGHTICVVQSLYEDHHLTVHDKLCRLLILMATLRDHGARRLIALVPYLCYARKDRRTKLRDPLTTRYVAQLFEAVSCDHVVTFGIHNPAAFENAFRCETTLVDLGAVFQDVMAWRVDDLPLVVMSPDPGGVKRTQLFRETLEERLGHQIGFGFMNKRRSGGVMTSGDVAGDFAGKAVLIVDDMIGSGGTMVAAAQQCRRIGAQNVYALAAHGLFTGSAETLFADGSIDRVFISDSVAPFRLANGADTPKLEVLGTAQAFSDVLAGL
jgi:ribose-phosphate pyrophosphokinase